MTRRLRFQFSLSDLLLVFTLVAAILFSGPYNVFTRALIGAAAIWVFAAMTAKWIASSMGDGRPPLS